MPGLLTGSGTGTLFGLGWVMLKGLISEKQMYYIVLLGHSRIIKYVIM